MVQAADPEAGTPTGEADLALDYVIWARQGEVAWVDLSRSTGSDTLRLDASTITLLQTAVAAHLPAPTVRSLGVGVRGGTVSMNVRQEWPATAMALSGGAIALLVALVVVVVRSRRRAARLLALARHDAASREAERTRVAREIHDGPLQDLAVLARTAGFGDQTRLREISAELRALAADLRPPALDQLGLAAALTDLSERWASSPSALAVRVSVDGVGRLGPDIELALYRIVQEALSNAATHGRARTAWVFLRALPPSRGGPSGLELVVRDDGDGIPLSFAASGRTEQKLLAGGHFGLVGMAERARALGAMLTVGPGPGDLGTEVHVRVPLRLADRRGRQTAHTYAGAP